MNKKLIMVCMAIAAFAGLVITPAASASPVLTSSTGASLSVGTSIEGKSTGSALFTGAFNVECSTAVLKGTLTENTGSAWKITLNNITHSGTATGGDCTSAVGVIKWTFNSELCVETIRFTDNVNVTGCEGKPVTFTLDLTDYGPCKYSTTSMTGTFTTSAISTINLNNQPVGKEEGGFFCTSSGNLTMDFDLYTGGSPNS